MQHSQAPPTPNTSCRPRTNPALGNSQWFLQALAGKALPAWEDGHSSPILSLLEDNAWDCGYESIQQNSFCLAPSLE